MEWNTFGLFEDLLREFEPHLRKARQVRSSKPIGTEALHAAVVGFLLFRPAEDWGRDEYEFITERLDGELALDALEWYEEAAPAIQSFSCLALGALLGKYAAGEINDLGFTLGDAHLPAFIALHNEEIHTRFQRTC